LRQSGRRASNRPSNGGSPIGQSSLKRSHKYDLVVYGSRLSTAFRRSWLSHAATYKSSRQFEPPVRVAIATDERLSRPFFVQRRQTFYNPTTPSQPHWRGTSPAAMQAEVDLISHDHGGSACHFTPHLPAELRRRYCAFSLLARSLGSPFGRRQRGPRTFASVPRFKCASGLNGFVVDHTSG